MGDTLQHLTCFVRTSSQTKASVKRIKDLSVTSISGELNGSIETLVSMLQHVDIVISCISPAHPQKRASRYLLAAAQHAVTKYLCPDNTPEIAKYLAYISANKLYPEFKYRSYAEFVDELIAGKTERPYPDEKF